MATLLMSTTVGFALFLQLMGVAVFSPLSVQPTDENQQSENGPLPPYLATVIVSLAISILLMQYSLWPSTFRKPPRPLLFLIQLLVALFIQEFVMNLIWFPLEGLIYDLCTTVSQATLNLEPAEDNLGMCCKIFQMMIQFLSSKWIPVIASYIMSLAFLGCVLHITKIQEVYKGYC
ncbi:uncharacterized protein LOC124165694 isoform X1 [Ischnura elegans]|uniref:uncharacterized protein LOC124165694 isoform X1 n=1 Tax=Ischnura elegans TaxID=197161 RepID=UPI001ED8886B|nr:uncharacterized protein LOC124165694 isoform X1 [Ischnura elegans]